MNNIAPINKGIPVLEKGTNFLGGVFLRWLQSVESRLNRAVVTDANGNVAYGGAVIPDDVESDFLHIFYGGGKVRIIDRNNGGTMYDGINAYIKGGGGGGWHRLIDGPCYLHRMSSLPSISADYYAGSSTAGTLIIWDQKVNIDFSGNINIKTGSTYTATL